ncbi:hypothetical protein TrLO_g5283 [Triparma laevis f. longispina]|uniref:Uncharacterized protein n=1 Tax=Triparma laevis f. longispina TaxID=1714387 RepID=A0A9W7KS47_9STRA|nr:hypothetical protein TrLO_g5283 [Triparma laevis f. longispina]
MLSLLLSNPTLAQSADIAAVPVTATTTQSSPDPASSSASSSAESRPADSGAPTPGKIEDSYYNYFSSFIYVPEDASPPAPVVKPYDWKTVAYAFIPEPTVFRMFVLAVLVSIAFSPKVRKSVMTYGGVAGICAWYAFRKALFRKDEHNKRRESIRINRTPSPKKASKKPGLSSLKEDKEESQSPKSKSPLGKIFGSGKKKSQ